MTLEADLCRSRKRGPAILLVDDSPSDAYLFAFSCAEGFGEHAIDVCYDGTQALQYLYRQNEYAEKPRPALLILDLHMPNISGFDVLHRVKSDPSLRSIPVVALASSRWSDDFNKAYHLGASCCLVKPLNLEELELMCQRLAMFWTAVAVLPDGGKSAEGDAPYGRNAFSSLRNSSRRLPLLGFPAAQTSCRSELASSLTSDANSLSVS